jgi:hypothetical protein
MVVTKVLIHPSPATVEQDRAADPVCDRVVHRSPHRWW